MTHEIAIVCISLKDSETINLSIFLVCICAPSLVNFSVFY